MAKFLTTEQLYRLIQRELPEGVYPDGPASAFYSTALANSKAQALASVYTNLQSIYNNYFPQLTDDRIADWEIKVFGEVADSTLSLADRRARILAKLRHQPSIALWEILTLAASYVPQGTYVQVVEWCHGDGGPWILGKSKLSVDTNLGFGNKTILSETGDDLCVFAISDGWRFGTSKLGSTTKLSGKYSSQTITAVQSRAYTYEIRIFSYTITGNDFLKFGRDVTAFEPARSAHVIKQNANLNSYGLIYPVSNVDQFSGINCITRDPLSSTGYSGLKHA